MRISAGLTLAASTAACLALITGCSGSGPTTDATPSNDASSTAPMSSEATGSAPTSSQAPSSGTSEGTAETRDVIENPPAKSWNDALEAARKIFPGDPIEIELEPRDRGGLEYKIELVTDAAQFEVQFDAESLEKLSSDEDQVGDDVAENRLKLIDTENIVALEDAAKTARGQQEGTITSWKLEGKDDGTVKYEFDILPRGSSDDVEVSINAKDGSVIADS
ncbi:MAG: PepSY domain-containing protein [Micrococcaceae bacterium]|nr:PepSY domain-containing protein [Micrococcaceae bacterium]